MVMRFHAAHRAGCQHFSPGGGGMSRRNLQIRRALFLTVDKVFSAGVAMVMRFHAVHRAGCQHFSHNRRGVPGGNFKVCRALFLAVHKIFIADTAVIMGLYAIRRTGPRHLGHSGNGMTFGRHDPLFDLGTFFTGTGLFPFLRAGCFFAGRPVAVCMFFTFAAGRKGHTQQEHQQ